MQISKMSVSGPVFTGKGLAVYELAFFRMLQSQKPEARGELDSRAWMGPYTVLLASADLSLSDQQLQLSLLKETMPAQLVGTSAYATWLGSDVLGLGFVFVADDAQKLDQLMQVKPCARDEAELAAMSESLATLDTADLTADLTLAAPALCD